MCECAPRTHAPAQMSTSTHTHTHKHTHTHAHAYPHTHIRTHARTSTSAHMNTLEVLGRVVVVERRAALPLLLLRRHVPLDVALDPVHQLVIVVGQRRGAGHGGRGRVQPGAIEGFELGTNYVKVRVNTHGGAANHDQEH